MIKYTISKGDLEGSCMKKKVALSLVTWLLAMVGVFIIGLFVGAGITYVRTAKLMSRYEAEEKDRVSTEVNTGELVKGVKVAENTEATTEENKEKKGKKSKKKGTVDEFIPKEQAVVSMKDLNSMSITEIRKSGKKVEKFITYVNRGTKQVYIVYMGYEGNKKSDVEDVDNIDTKFCKAVAEYYNIDGQEYVQTATGGWKEGHDYKDVNGKDRVFSSEFEGMFDEVWHNYIPEYKTTDEAYEYSGVTENEDGSVINEKMLVNKNTYRLVSFSQETLKDDKVVSSITKSYTGFDVTNIGDMLTLSTEAEVTTTEEKTEEGD